MNGTSNGTAVTAAEDLCATGGPLLDRPAIQVPFIVAYICVFFLCLIGNLFTILVICWHRSMRTATNFFLANLAVADLLVAIFCILQNMMHLVGTSYRNNWPLGEAFCKLYAFVLHLVPCTGIGILVCVSVEKYIAVLHPLLALKALTPRFRALMMAAIWAISLLFNLPYYTTTKYYSWAGGQVTACSRVPVDDPMWQSGWAQHLSTRNMISLSFLLWYCVPLCTIAFLYTRIGLVLWHSAPLNKLTQLAALRTSSNETTVMTTAAANGHQQQKKLSVLAMARGGIRGYRMSASAATGTNGVCATGNGMNGELAAAAAAIGAARHQGSQQRSNSQPMSNSAALNLLPLIRVNRSATTANGVGHHGRRSEENDSGAELDNDDEEEAEEEFEAAAEGEQDEEERQGGKTGGRLALGNGAAVVPAQNLDQCHQQLGQMGGGQQKLGISTAALVVSTVESRKKIIRLLIAIVFSFAVLTLPHHARLLYSAWYSEKICLNGVEALVQPITYLLLFLSSSCNPFLYAFMSQRFRSAIRDIFKCRRGRVRRKSTRTRTQNSDIAGFGHSSVGEAAGASRAVSRCSSLNRLNFNGVATAQNGGQGLMTAAGSERNLLLVNQQQQPRGSAGSGNHLKVHSLDVRKGGRSGSGGSTASTASSTVMYSPRSNGGGSTQMAVIYRKSS